MALRSNLPIRVNLGHSLTSDLISHGGSRMGQHHVCHLI